MGTRANILVVDDELTNILLLKIMLLNAGYNVFPAKSGEEALNILHSEKIDIVLTDWLMPIMDGVELIKKIRSNKEIKSPFIIMVTALDSKESREKALDSGADDYVTKPVDQNELLEIIEQSLLIYSDSI